MQHAVQVKTKAPPPARDRGGALKGLDRGRVQRQDGRGNGLRGFGLLGWVRRAAEDYRRVPDGFLLRDRDDDEREAILEAVRALDIETSRGSA